MQAVKVVTLVCLPCSACSVGLRLIVCHGGGVELPAPPLQAVSLSRLFAVRGVVSCHPPPLWAAAAVPVELGKTIPEGDISPPARGRGYGVEFPPGIKHLRGWLRMGKNSGWGKGFSVNIIPFNKSSACAVKGQGYGYLAIPCAVLVDTHNIPGAILLIQVCYHPIH